MPEENNERQSNNIWGKKFTRLSLFILIFAILLALSRYLYLKLTDQYPVRYEEQELIQYPHLESLEKDSHERDTLLEDARTRE